MIVKSQVNAFIVTLAMDFALLGFVTFVYVTFTGATAAFTTKPDGMEYWRTTSLHQYCIAGHCGPRVFPMMLIPAIIALSVVGFMYTKTRLGRELLATGSNLRAARLSGIPVDRRVITAHTLSGSLLLSPASCWHLLMDLSPPRLVLNSCCPHFWVPSLAERFLLVAQFKY
jgi:ribose transport system permease protein